MSDGHWAIRTHGPELVTAVSRTKITFPCKTWFLSEFQKPVFWCYGICYNYSITIISRMSRAPTRRCCCSTCSFGRPFLRKFDLIGCRNIHGFGIQVWIQTVGCQTSWSPVKPDSKGRDMPIVIIRINIWSQANLFNVDQACDALCRFLGFR